LETGKTTDRHLFEAMRITPTNATYQVLGDAARILHTTIVVRIERQISQVEEKMARKNLGHQAVRLQELLSQGKRSDYDSKGNAKENNYSRTDSIE
jgi:hypothetical protein